MLLSRPSIRRGICSVYTGTLLATGSWQVALETFSAIGVTYASVFAASSCQRDDVM